MKKTLLGVLLSVTAICLIGCSSPGGGGENGKEKTELYSDLPSYVADKYEISYGSISSYKSTNHQLSFVVSLTNKTLETENYSLLNTSIIRESNGAEYKVSANSLNSSLNVQPDCVGNVTYYAEIPTSVSEEEYSFSFTLEKHNYVFHLFETPDELRADIEVEYIVEGESIHKTTVKERRALGSNYLYESADHLYYNTSWYTDTNCTKLQSNSESITEKKTLYGKKNMNIKMSTTGTDAFSFVNGVNHVPTDKVLVIPEKYQNKEICIGNYAIRNLEANKVYLPKTIHTVYGNNFTGLLNDAVIYYAGTESEWNAITFYANDFPKGLKVVFNTSFKP